MWDLLNTINNISKWHDHDENAIRVPSDFCVPGFWVILSAYSKSEQIPKNHVFLPPGSKGYASAIGLSKALWDFDDYPHERRNEGQNYSLLEHLSCPEATDQATSHVNGCIRNFLGSDKLGSFVAQLCDVVGDVHDNIWSHGITSGFSMAQRWRVSVDSDDALLEFALADSGLGFLGEIKRVGMSIDNHRETIEWCIQPGNSTKKRLPQSDWAQRMPADITNNPLKGIEKTTLAGEDSHHQGLGLYKLIQLVKTFAGKLWLASGDQALIMEHSGQRGYITLETPWKGVALACRFRLSLVNNLPTQAAPDQRIERIKQSLRGGHHG